MKRCSSVGVIASAWACVSLPAVTAAASSVFSAATSAETEPEADLPLVGAGDLRERLAGLELRQRIRRCRAEVRCSGVELVARAVQSAVSDRTGSGRM